MIVLRYSWKAFTKQVFNMIVAHAIWCCTESARDDVKSRSDCASIEDNIKLKRRKIVKHLNKTDAWS